MSASQTLHLIEKLTEADIPKETATELLEFVEKRQTDLVTKDHFEARMDAFEARMAATDAKIDKLDMKIASVKNELGAKITGIMLFLGFNTTLLAALIILMLRMSFG